MRRKKTRGKYLRATLGWQQPRGATQQKRRNDCGLLDGWRGWESQNTSPVENAGVGAALGVDPPPSISAGNAAVDRRRPRRTKKSLIL